MAGQNCGLYSPANIPTDCWELSESFLVVFRSGTGFGRVVFFDSLWGHLLHPQGCSLLRAMSLGKGQNDKRKKRKVECSIFAI